MKISELILELEGIKDEDGDLNCYFNNNDQPLLKEHIFKHIDVVGEDKTAIFFEDPIYETARKNENK
jgi:hypothetical protein